MNKRKIKGRRTYCSAMTRNFELKPEGGASAESKNGGEQGTRAVPSALKQSGSSCAYNKTRSNRFNFVKAMTLKSGFKNPIRH